MAYEVVDRDHHYMLILNNIDKSKSQWHASLLDRYFCVVLKLLPQKDSDALTMHIICCHYLCSFCYMGHVL